jgi:phage shock protein C
MNKLSRSRDRKIAGVCGGLAAHWGTDPLWVRVAAAVLLIPFFAPILVAYVVLWWLLPEASE